MVVRGEIIFFVKVNKKKQHSGDALPPRGIHNLVFRDHENSRRICTTRFLLLFFFKLLIQEKIFHILILNDTQYSNINNLMITVLQNFC